jgi:hypothetical protein
MMGYQLDGSEADFRALATWELLVLSIMLQLLARRQCRRNKIVFILC